jgi:hypothetical protein
VRGANQRSLPAASFSLTKKMITNNLDGAIPGLTHGRKMPLVFMAMGAVAICFEAGAFGGVSPISWVNGFVSSGSGPFDVSGGDSQSGLAVAASFSSRTVATWSQGAAVIPGADWPFTGDRSTTFWQMYQETAFSSTATVDFVNSGGLPAGGSVSIADLESTGSSITIAGFVWSGSGYQQVDVAWELNNFELNPASAQPNWNSVTKTLTGGGGPAFSGIDTFAILTSSARLDRLVLTIDLVAGDGIGIGFTETDVAGAMIPSFGGLGAFGVFGVLGRRRRS